MAFGRAIFNDFSAWAEFVCQQGCGAGDRALTREVQMYLTDVEAHLQEPVGDPIQLIRDSRCLYGCGRSSISTGVSRLNGREVQVEMSCDDCGGDWKEFYRVPDAWWEVERA